MIYVMAMAGTAKIKVSHTGGGNNSKPVRMGIYFDMDAGEVVYFNKENNQPPRYGEKMKYLPKDVVIAIAHPKHGMQATFERS